MVPRCTATRVLRRLLRSAPGCLRAGGRGGGSAAQDGRLNDSTPRRSDIPRAAPAVGRALPRPRLSAGSLSGEAAGACRSFHRCWLSPVPRASAQSWMLSPAMRRSPHGSGWLAPALLIQTMNPVSEGRKKLGNEVPRRLVRQLSLRIEFVLGLRNHDLWTVQDVRVEEDEHLPQMILSATRSQGTLACAHDRDRLAIERLFGRARDPVDRVLEDPRYE